VIHRLYVILSLLFVSLSPVAYAKNISSDAITAPIPISQLTDYSKDPLVVRKLIVNAQHLSQMNLTYLYGSSDPKNKGMDCSGTIYYLLSLMELSNVPRQSDELYDWVAKKGNLYKVTSNKFSSLEFSKLKPGDLLFWSGTYITNRRSPISHVMIYLGKNKSGQRLMFGASDGRTYQGKKMWGVSVFDFELPDGKGKQRFVGYSCIPELTCG
jgi:cell wall-associated NlpC family hydrolase